MTSHTAFTSHMKSKLRSLKFVAYGVTIFTNLT